MLGFCTPENRLGYVVDTVRIAQCRSGRKSAFKCLGSAHCVPGSSASRKQTEQAEACCKEGGCTRQRRRGKLGSQRAAKRITAKIFFDTSGGWPVGPHLTTSS